MVSLIAPLNGFFPGIVSNSEDLDLVNPIRGLALSTTTSFHRWERPLLVIGNPVMRMVIVHT